MSHVASVDMVITEKQIRDGILAAAIADLGGEIITGQKTYSWYGRTVGDFHDPLFESLGIKPGVCEHAIRLKGAAKGDYEAGICKLDDGTYRVVWDSWGSGQKLDAAFGKGASKLKDEVGVEIALRHAQRQGKRARRAVDAQGVYVDIFLD